MGIAIVAMILGFTLIVVKMGLDYSKSRLEALPEAPSDATLLMSELEEMIADAVAEATRPLEQRIEKLEALSLPEAERPRALAPPEEGKQAEGEVE